MNKGLKNKGLGSWFCLAAALVALITGIVFLSTQAAAAPLGHSGTMAGVVLLVGAAASLVFFFVSVPFSALIQAVIYNIALYLVVVQLYFVFADVINCRAAACPRPTMRRLPPMRRRLLPMVPL